MIVRMAGVTLLCFLLSDVARAAEPLRIAHIQSLPPLVDVQEGKSVGLAIDIVRAAAARTGIEVVFVPVTLEHLMPSLKDGRADVLLTANTPDSQQSLDFSAPVLMT